MSQQTQELSHKQRVKKREKKWRQRRKERKRKEQLEREQQRQQDENELERQRRKEDRLIQEQKEQQAQRQQERRERQALKKLIQAQIAREDAGEQVALPTNQVVSSPKPDTSQPETESYQSNKTDLTKVDSKVDSMEQQLNKVLSSVYLVSKWAKDVTPVIESANSFLKKNIDLENDCDVAFGTNALNNTNSGNNNSALGCNTLSSLTSGAHNTAVGSSALRTNTTGGANVAIGSYSLALNTTGTQNTATGYYALGTNTTGQKKCCLRVPGS